MLILASAPSANFKMARPYPMLSPQGNVDGSPFGVCTYHPAPPALNNSRCDFAAPRAGNFPWHRMILSVRDNRWLRDRIAWNG